MRSLEFLLIAAMATVPLPAEAQGFMPSPRDVATCPRPPGGGDIVVLSIYGGEGAPLPYSLQGDEQGGHAVTVAGSGGGRVRLVITAHESTVWDLSAISPRVESVIAYGYYPQGISGLPASTPVRFVDRVSSGSRGGPPDPCHIEAAHDGMYKIQQQADQIERVLGAHPRRWYGGYKPSSFNIDGGPGPTVSAPPASRVRAGVPVLTTGLMPGNDGLEQLVQAGALRRFAKSDLDAWASKGGRLEMTGGPFMRSAGAGGHDPIEYVGQATSGYLVLKSLSQIPAGLGGADSVVFVVPDGVSIPTKAGHSAIYRLSGYPGRIPPAGQVVPIDMRAQMIARSSGGRAAQAAAVEWDAGGRVTKDGTAAPPSEGAQIIRPDLRAIPLEADRYTGRDEPFIDPVPESEKSRDMTPSALVAATLFALGAAGLVLNRRRTGRPSYPFPEEGMPSVAAPRETIAIERAEITALPGGATAAAEVDQLSASLQQAIDLAYDDATALALLKFKRTIVRAMQDPEYDDDIADELDAIVERHMAETVAVYVKAARRTSGARSEVVETTLRKGVERLTGRVAELIDEQAARDAERLRQRGEFIRARHPDGDSIGGDA